MARGVRALLCRIVGHKWRQKMYGRLCRRCEVFEGIG